MPRNYPLLLILEAQSEGTGTDTLVDLKLSVIKPVAAGWIVSLYDCIKCKPELVKMYLRKLA